MSRPQRARVVVVVTTVALAAAAVATQTPRRAAADAAATRAANAAATAEGVPGLETRAAAWFCAAGGAGAPGGSAAESIVIANAGRATVTAYVEPIAGRKPSPFRRVDVAPRSRSTVKLSDMPDANEVGVIVETFGGLVGVEHELETGKDFAALPCSRRANDRWYFASGSTARDAKEVIALMNPFFDDAVVDMTFTTDDGLKRPPALRGLVVPARTRVNVVVNDHVPRQEHVAAFVASQRGRIVAERTQSFDGSNGRAGYAATLGQTTTRRDATFAEGLVVDGVKESIVVYNPSDTDADVSVHVDLDGDQTVPARDVAVPGQSAAVVDLDPPKGVGHSIVVHSDRAVVIEQTTATRPPAPRTGLEILAPAPLPAKQWLFASGQADAARDEWLTIKNSSSQPVHAHITILAGGQLLVPEKLDALVIAPGKRLTVRLGDSLQRPDTPLLLVADGPVIAVRGVYGDGFSFASGLSLPR